MQNLRDEYINSQINETLEKTPLPLYKFDFNKREATHSLDEDTDFNSQMSYMIKNYSIKKTGGKVYSRQDLMRDLCQRRAFGEDIKKHPLELSKGIYYLFYNEPLQETSKRYTM